MRLSQPSLTSVCDIGNLFNLVEIFLTDNKLEALPASFGKLSSLVSGSNRHSLLTVGARHTALLKLVHARSRCRLHLTTFSLYLRSWENLKIWSSFACV